MSGINAGLQETKRAKEGVAVLMNDEWHSTVIDFGSVSSRTLWVKFKFSRVKVLVVIVYGPTEQDVLRKGEVLE